MKSYLKKLIFISYLSVCTSASAAIITVPLNYTTDPEDNQDLNLSGSLVIDTTQAGAETRDQIASTRESPIAVPAWITSITLTVADSDPSDGDQTVTFSKEDFQGFVWEPKTANIGNVDFTSSLVPQFDDIAFLKLGGTFNSVAPFRQDLDDDEFTLTSTPSPLLIPGVLPILYFFKKLKNIKKLKKA